MTSHAAAAPGISRKGRGLAAADRIPMADRDEFHAGQHPPCCGASSAKCSLPAVACAGCGERIGCGVIMTAMEKKWHPECFRCCICKEAIKEQSFTTVNGRPCHSDCKPGELCAGCGRTIRSGVIMTALHKKWHPECFRCCICGDSIQDSTFTTQGGKPCHPSCKPGEACARCGEKMRGEITNALGKKWHPECFRCSLCGKAIADASFSTVEGRPCHSRCKPGEPCAGCGQKLAGGVVTTALGQKWHPECFLCGICGKVIRDANFSTHDGEQCHTSCKPRSCGRSRGG
eukprot:RCo048080